MLLPCCLDPNVRREKQVDRSDEVIGMVNNDGTFEIELIADGIPGVVLPDARMIKGRLSPAALKRFRALEQSSSPVGATARLRQAANRRSQKVGRPPGDLVVTVCDFEAPRFR